ncbi:integrase/recombinase XerD [Paraburkholderia sp. GAS448]|uniref:tyrosine-type recombinase/integrase n=1 Tax=Paraburkholderia sp. GAS448 TaxID=3035136 RepID=UPI003D20E709
MFDQIFKRASAVARHSAAPFAEERIRYLDYCVDRGDSYWSIRRKAHDLLWISQRLRRRSKLCLTVDQVRSLVVDRADREVTSGPRLDFPSTRRRLTANACTWLRFLGTLREPVDHIPFGSRLNEYAEWAKQERGLSDATIDRFSRNVRQFLKWYGPLGRPLSGVHATDIDAYLAFGKGRGWARVTVSNTVDALQAFFRFGGQQGWCNGHLANAIPRPRIYALEGLPTGPSWPDVQRLLAALDTPRPADIRDRTILMLFAIYALRESEVANLRLEDIDWQRDQLHIRRAKRGKEQVYPLLPSVGNALVRYLQSVRRSSNHREVFLTLMSPFRPLSLSGLYDIVSYRLKSSNIKSPHYGPHCLRHACGTRLVTEGLTLKEIGDHLGHRRTSSTRAYAKVNLPGLREVAAFDLGALS